MTLTDAQKKKISDRALGDAISQNVNIHDQLAAIRKQVVALSEAVKIPLSVEFSALEMVVSDERASSRKTGGANSIQRVMKYD